MQDSKLSGKFEFGGKSLTVNLKVVFFEEDNIFYAYLPTLDLTGYGKTGSEAKESLKVVFDEFLRYTLNKNTFFIELQRLGWNIKNKKKYITKFVKKIQESCKQAKEGKISAIKLENLWK